MREFRESDWTATGSNGHHHRPESSRSSENSNLNRNEETHDGGYLQSSRNDNNAGETPNSAPEMSRNPNANAFDPLPGPAFFVGMSHVHTLQSACRCIQVQPTCTLRTLTQKYKRLARHPNIGCSREDSTRIFQCISRRSYVS